MSINDEPKDEIPEKVEKRVWGGEVTDSYDYVEVVKNTFGVSKEPIKTCYLNPCVGVIAFNPETRTAGVLHIKESRKLDGVHEDITKMLDELKKSNLQWNKDLIELHILGGWEGYSLHSSVESSLKNMGFPERNIRSNEYTPHEEPNMHSMEGRYLDSFSTPISVMIDPQDGSLHRIKGDLLKSKVTNTGSVFNPQWWGGAHKTPDSRSL